MADKSLKLIGLTGLIASGLCAFGFCDQAKGESSKYPEALSQQNTEIIHNNTVMDPYRWMEDVDSERLSKWTEAQNKYTLERLSGEQIDAAAHRIKELYTFDQAFGAKMRGDKLFYLQRGSDDSRVSIFLKVGKQLRRLLHSDDVPDTGNEKSFIGGRNFSPWHWADREGNMVAYWYNDGTSRSGKVRIIDANTRLHLPDVLVEIGNGLTVVDWSADGNGFYYVRSKDVPVDEGTGSRTETVGLYFHKLGTEQASDVVVIDQQNEETFIYYPNVSADGRHLVVARSNGFASENDYLVFNTNRLSVEPTPLFRGTQSRFIYLGSQGSRFLFQTNYQAQNGRVIAVDLNQPSEIVTIVEETDLPMLAGSNVGGDVIGFFSGNIIVGYLRDGVPDIQVFDIEGRPIRTLDIPTGTTIWGGLQGSPGSSRFSVGLLSGLSPSHLVSFAADGSDLRDEYLAKTPYDDQDYLVERVFYKSKDGTRVPMYVSRRKDTQLNGNNPTLVYGYGMHQWVSFLFYQAHIIHWLELGGVYAMPAIRGGGEYGDAWHQDGILLNRQNAIDDFVWAGKALIEMGYTRNDRLAANGSSASGPLAAQVAVQFSDVFAASTIDYPVADMVRAPLYGNGRLMTAEYGSLQDPEQAQVIIDQSPYQMVQKGACFAPSLVMVGESDRVILPFHGEKLAAAMQANQSCGSPVLFYLMRQTGHNYGQSPALFARNTAVQIAFLRHVLAF